MAHMILQRHASAETFSLHECVLEAAVINQDLKLIEHCVHETDTSQFGHFPLVLSYEKMMWHLPVVGGDGFISD